MIYLFSYKAQDTIFHYFSGNYVVSVKDNDLVYYWTHIDGYLQYNITPFEYEIPELRVLDFYNNLGMLKKYINDIVEEKIFNNI